MKKIHVLFEQEDYRWIVLHRDPDKKEGLIDSNEYVITHKGKHFLLDPGGFEIFPTVLASLVQVIDPQEISGVFSSHQDPDIASNFSLWQEIVPELQCHVSWLWSSFMPHFGGDENTFISIPDKGMELNHNGLKLIAVPAHHMHSAGNLHLYDPSSKIYFSGDTGAAILPDENRYLFIDDFEAHIPFIEPFHRRWFGSNGHKNNWCEKVQELEIEILCPQHGAIYVGEQVWQFVDWLHKLNVGTTRNRVK